MTFYIPVRNAERTLPAAIAGLRAQTVQPAECLLVVDVRSTDRTSDLARDSGLPIVEQTAGRLGFGRNLAIQHCRTDWLASCDADVELEPTWLERLLDRATEPAAAVGGCTLERLITPADRWRAVNLPHNWGPAPFDNPFMLVSEMLARAAALRSIGGYVPDLFYYDDSDVCQRLRQAGYTLRYEPSAVAHHDRRDSPASVLKLRWEYAYPRQRGKLESLAGLISKLPVNRVYALQSLSQTLHSEHVEVAAISVLLWFHHARADLDAALERWPLLDEAGRTECRTRLAAALTAGMGPPWRELTIALERLLPGLLVTVPAVKGAPSRPAASLVQTPGFANFLAAVTAATRALLAEIPEPVATTVLDSAARLALDAAPARPGPVGRPTRPVAQPVLAVSAEDEQRLARQPLRPAWRWAELASMLTPWLDGQPLPVPLVYGRAHESETPEAGEHSSRHAARPRAMVLLPHLETAARPKDALHAALAEADIAVVAYQPGETFIAAVPVLTARDLAGLCAAEGLEIRNFHTEAGLIRLVLTRPPGRRRSP